jgi:hypothetical protein
MRWTVIAAALLAATSAHAETTMKYPQIYKFMIDTAASTDSDNYFRCDYTSKTCERGRAWGSNRVFEMVSDDDRKTVIGHGACHVNGGRWTSWVCWNFDTGVYVGVINGGNDQGQMTVADTYNWPRPIW